MFGMRANESANFVVWFVHKSALILFSKFVRALLHNLHGLAAMLRFDKESSEN